MKLYSLESTPYEPESHDPGLRKKVLLRDVIPSVEHVSHIVLLPGNHGSMHSHPEAFEVLYCVRGAVLFIVKEEEFVLKKGDCLIVEPGEPHALPDVIEETELLYFKVSEARGRSRGLL